MEKTYTARIGEQDVVISTGKLAGLAGGAVTVRTGDTMVLVTATGSKSPREGIDFFPLSVEFEERLYAAGRIPGSFFRREGRPSEAAILVARLIDRPLRPLFPKDFRNDVQVVATTISYDVQNYLDIPAIIGASAALMISDVPFYGPVGAVRVGLVDGQFIMNPTADQMEKSELDLRMAGTADAILMVEAGANQVPEDKMLEALKAGHAAMQGVIALQNEMAKEVGKPKVKYPGAALKTEITDKVKSHVGTRITDVFAQPLTKEAREAALDTIEDEVMAALVDLDPAEAKAGFESVMRDEVRNAILDKGVRPDGRGVREIRPISSEVGLSPRAHGSGLFTRGQTQVLSIATLGTVGEVQELDGLRPEDSKRYIHHYNFPPFSTGETYPMRGPRRREIGHGALAETALRYVVPPEAEFPYAIRIVSEVLSSNGSTSMGSVCASTLALMDAGVKIAAPVSGIAMGLVTRNDGKYAILSDIQGVEDHLGDMDFKVAGTEKGITALQMDIKIRGLSAQIMEQALAQAREGRMFILGKMLGALAAPREEMSRFAPRVTIIKIDSEKIGKVIGPGGKMIRSITEQFGVKIDIEDDGSVYISSVSAEGAAGAVAMIRGMTEDAKIGEIYTGKVVRVADFGAFIEILPGVDGMVHISQLADFRVNRVEDVVKLGDELTVMVIDVDPAGKIRLSRQAVMEGWTAEEARERDRKPSGGGGPRSGPGRDGPRGGGRPGGGGGGFRGGRR
ncbi:MAG: polyribonucleotide nucleotidyltransferase [Chloroflexi bacterium]|nr:polyribonucleotide nucleotidyltransferase [Chloroflexota bacterium]